MEKRMLKEKVTGAIQGMQMAGASEKDIISKIIEKYNVTKDYVLALLAPQKA